MRVYKRGNRWYFDGIVDGERQRSTLGPLIKTREQAENWLKGFQSSVSEQLLRQFITAYLKSREPYLSPKTIESYRETLRNFESFVGIDRPLPSITARDISAWAASLLRRGLKPVTVNVHLRNIKAALNRAAAWELITKPPVVEMVKVPNHQPRHLTEEQFKSLLEHEFNFEYRRLWSFMVWTAVRRSEALGVRWEHVTLGERPQVLITGKGDKQRVVPLLPPAVAALGHPGACGPVFQVGAGTYVTHRFRDMARAAGIKAKLHDLRHTGLTWMVAHGVPVKLVQDIAGHTSIATTMIYAKTYAGESYEVLKKAFEF